MKKTTGAARERSLCSLLPSAYTAPTPHKTQNQGGAVAGLQDRQETDRRFLRSSDQFEPKGKKKR